MVGAVVDWSLMKTNASANRPSLPPFRLETHFSQWEFRARHHMCASDLQSMSLAELLSMAAPADREAWDALQLGYTETRGLPRLREAIASTYEAVAPSDLICFAGAEEAIFAAMNAILSPADHAVTVIPNYQSLESIPLSLCEVTGVPLDPDNRWELDLDRVRQALRPSTRLICINFPHNPTGKIISRQTLEGLIALARERQIFLFSDEVYRGVERRPISSCPRSRTCTSGAFRWGSCRRRTDCLASGSAG